ncbi:MAG TPA: ASKHA domain-containing protein [Anaerolineaceae bacterium]
MGENKLHKIDLEPIGRRVEVPAGTTLLEAAQKAGIDLVASCGGVGICGTCRVRVIQGSVSPVSLTEQEALDADQVAAGFRLACQVYPQSDVRLDIPPESLTSAQKMQVDGREVETALDPAVQPIDLDLPAPHLEDLRSDLDRAGQALAERGFPPLQGSLERLAEVSSTLRTSGWQARLAIQPNAHFSNLVAVYPKSTPLAGVAMDIGSTKLAIYLVDLESGATLARLGAMNPQIAYGEDVVSRIAFANRSPENRRLLQTRLVETINQSIETLCQSSGIRSSQIVDVTAVGNTAMHHLFCGLPVEQLGAAPYVPVVSAPLSFRAGEINLNVAPDAQVFLPANIAGYVGADHVAALLATRSYAADHTTVLVDIGTNTEISLTHQGKVFSCSTASGPAFEGAHIRDGMRAAPGAIERVHLSASDAHISTIAGQPPVGICGSGILTTISEMLAVGAIDARGVINPADRRVRSRNNRNEFILVPAEQTGHGREIVVTRKCINEIQLAKGAIRAGINILLTECGITPADVQDFIIAGAFGTHLDLESALQIGMFPDLPHERFHQVGNAAGVGAKQMLLSRRKRDEAAHIVKNVSYIELTTYNEFTAQFVEAMYLRRGENL